MTDYDKRDIKAKCDDARAQSQALKDAVIALHSLLRAIPWVSPVCPVPGYDLTDIMAILDDWSSYSTDLYVWQVEQDLTENVS